MCGADHVPNFVLSYNAAMFRRKKTTDADGFLETGVEEEEIVEGQMVRVKAGGTAIVLASLDGTIAAFGDTCPHGAASLSAGSLRGRQVCCPEHGYCFDIGHGRIVWPEDEVYRLHRYEAKVENGRIKVRPVTT